MGTCKQTENYQLTPSQILWGFQQEFVPFLSFSKEAKKLLEGLRIKNRDWKIGDYSWCWSDFMEL